MAKLITKFQFIKPGSHAGAYLKYIATREGVDKIDDSKKHHPATKKQKELIAKILQDFPDSKEMLEYEDYQNTMTTGAASEFITRAVEDNAAAVMDKKTYADYIATRPRAQRFGSHGLFTEDDVEVKLSNVSKELNLHEGNVWTAIVSLRREDAVRLGFDCGERWRDMLRTQIPALAENLKIPMENLQWFAAFHNESHHPHVHLMAYSIRPNEGYLTKQGVMSLRASFAKDIFAQDLLCVYEKETAYRDELRSRGREFLKRIIGQINAGGYDHPEMEQLLLDIAGRLEHTHGKLVYGYLPKGTKDLIDKAVDLLAADERIAELYDLWYEQKEEILRTYNKELPQRLPLSRNQEFKSIRNAVVQEALHLTADRPFSLDDEPDEAANIPESATESEFPDEGAVPFGDLPDAEPVQPDNSDSGKWWSKEYKQARRALYGTKEQPPDLEQAYILMLQEAETGNGYAMHDMGKILLQGIGRDKDEAAAQQWFQKAYAAFRAAEQTADKKDYLQYRIGKLFSFGYGVEQNYAQAAEWYGKAVVKRNPYAAYSLGGLYKRGQGVEQDDGRAFQLFRLAAEHERKPNAYAMYELGRMFKQGTGTEPDMGLSEKWYAAAYWGFVAMAETINDDKLQYRLGQMTMNGVGTEKDLLAAFLYFQKSAALGNSDAEYGLGRLYLNKEFEQHDPQKAVEHLTKAAEAGHDMSQYTLGKLYLEGKVVAKDVPRGLWYLEQALAKENQFAQYLLGKTLLKGEDVAADPLRGEQLLAASAAQGNLYAAYTLGKAYLEGKMLAQNIPRGLELLEFAAGQNLSEAQYTLGKVYAEGTVVPRNIVAALHLFTQAAMQGNPFAQYRLASLYLAGEDIPKDVPAALYWLRRSAEQENDYASYQLGKLYLYGTEVKRNIGEAVAFLTASVALGNPYAAQLLQRYRQGKTRSAAMGIFRLLLYTAKAIGRKLGADDDGGPSHVDRKLQRKIDEKKMLHGMRI